ncbi:MAG: hypothetical protein PHD48_00955 [Alphaproteobacteria bacterium]|nr:hypothetical protein [Alphaproteobacteria bacterium]
MKFVPVMKITTVTLAALTCFGNTTVGAKEAHEIDPSLYAPNSLIAQAVKRVDDFRKSNWKAAQAAKNGDCSAATEALTEATNSDLDLMPFVDADKNLREAVRKSIADSFNDTGTAVQFCNPRSRASELAL